MKVGFIGLGAMGFPMAQRVIKAGFPLITTFHRRREPADALASLGAKVVRTPVEVASEADVIVTILPANLKLEETIPGAGWRTRRSSSGWYRCGCSSTS